MSNRGNHITAFETEQFLILGHRGSPREAPENTLPSFLKAREQGAGGIELDVHLARDGAIVVFHNYTLSKTTGGRGLLAGRTLEELKQLDAGSSFSSEFAGTPIPTLQEVIEALDEDTFIMIEIKSYLGKANGQIAGAVAGVVAEYDLYERVVASSFNPFILKKVKEADRHVPVGFLHHLPCPGFPGGRSAPPGGPEVLHPFYKVVGKSYMEQARRRGCRVIPWTVNEVAEMHRMIGLGVEGLISDRPGVIKDALRNATGKEKEEEHAR